MHPFARITFSQPRPRVEATGMHALVTRDGTLVLTQKRQGNVTNEEWRYQRR
jgi:hypothetical protein